MFNASRIAFIALTSALSVFASHNAPAQAYPDKPIRIIVSNPPGSISDIVARTVGSEMSKILRQPVIVESKVGANQLIAYRYVAKKVPAGGYTLAFVTRENMAIMPATVKDLQFDPLNDLPPIIGLVEAKMVLASPLKAPWKNFQELVAYAKANPGKLNYGSSSPVTQLPVEALKYGLGMDIVNVMYPGAVNVQLITGEIQLTFFTETYIIGFEDKLRVLAITGSKRVCPKYCDVPTFAELGFPQIPSIGFSLNAPVGTPKAVLDILFAAASRALREPEVRAILEKKFNLEIVGQTPEVASKLFKERVIFFNGIAKETGVQPQ
ncbi:MAG: tripartite tricarboxylate transporter substrate binding protein [Betaproteobacteria bacterium]|nr:tripartite tricarboxylate transporter substrate binding protein [Betaproteobacteria bacterium]